MAPHDHAASLPPHNHDHEHEQVEEQQDPQSVVDPCADQAAPPSLRAGMP